MSRKHNHTPRATIAPAPASVTRAEYRDQAMRVTDKIGQAIKELLSTSGPYYNAAVLSGVFAMADALITTMIEKTPPHEKVPEVFHDVKAAMLRTMDAISESLPHDGVRRRG